MKAPSVDAELRSHIASLGEGEEHPVECPSCWWVGDDVSECLKPRKSDDYLCPECGTVVQDYNPDRWVPFVFDALGVYGVAWNRDLWDRMRETWSCINPGINASKVFDAKCKIDSVKVGQMNFNGEQTSMGYFQSFGDSEEHAVQKTLRDFFKKNGMRL